MSSTQVILLALVRVMELLGDVALQLAGRGRTPEYWEARAHELSISSRALEAKAKSEAEI